jgi:G protein beta subunit-like protein
MSVPSIVTAGCGLSIQLSPIFKGQPTAIKFQKITFQNSQVNRIVVPSENRVAIAANPWIVLYDIQPNGTNKPTLCQGHQANVTDLIFLDSHFFSCSEDRSWQIWDRGQPRAAAKVATSSALNSMALHDPLLITANERGQVDLWDVRATDHPVASRRVGQLPVRSIAWPRSGAGLIAGCHDGTVCIIDVRDDGFGDSRQFRAHDQTLLRIALAPDESAFVTTSADSSAKLWSLATFGQNLFVLQDADQVKWVWDAAFTNDSRFVCTAGTDKFFRTWDCQTGKLLWKNGEAHSKGITAIAIYQS